MAGKLYCYFDENGELLETISDGSVRRMDSGIDKIYVYWHNEPVFTSLFKQYFTDWTNPKIGNRTQLTETRDLTTIPAIKNQDLKYFIQGQEYNFITITLDTLNGTGAAALSIYAQISQTVTIALAPITFAVDNSVAKLSPEITDSQFNYLLYFVGQKVNDVLVDNVSVVNNVDRKAYISTSNFVTLNTSQTITGIKTFAEKQLFQDGIQTDYLYNKLGETKSIYLHPADIEFYQTIVPKNDNSLEIGTELYRWKDLYLSGELSNGTNSITIAHIEDNQNKVTSIDSYSTNTQYPSAKLLYDTKADLQTQITNLSNRGRFLSNWNAVTGKPTTEPTTPLPYSYRAGDYYIVSNVGTTNYKPTGSSYNGQASTTQETEDLSVGAIYTYDGANWVLSGGAVGTITIQQVSGLQTALDSKESVAHASSTYVTLASESWSATFELAEE